MAFDHDLLSFTDTALGKWPLVLLTNPKNAKFLVPSKEPTQRMLNSSHVRMLVFSTASIVSIEMEIDGMSLPPPAAVGGGPLYVSQWQPTNYAVGLHEIKVVVKDSADRVTVSTQPFSLDDTLSHIDKLPQLLILTDFHSLVSFLTIVLAASLHNCVKIFSSGSCFSSFGWLCYLFSS